VDRGPLLSPPTDTVDSSFTVSSWPSGHKHGSLACAIGRVFSNVAPQARQRYSYRGTPAAYANCRTGGHRRGHGLLTGTDGDGGTATGLSS
jgi:hypothetical protein